MSVPRVAEPPGKVTPYVVPAYQGETLTIPGTKSTVRVLASAKESEGSISVFHFDGVLGDPVGFHHHNESHDIFMCTRGYIKLWAGDQCRLLGPGDFCSVPPVVILIPTIIHSMLISHTESSPPTPASGPMEREPWSRHSREMGRLLPLCLREIPWSLDKGVRQPGYSAAHVSQISNHPGRVRCDIRPRLSSLRGWRVDGK